MRERKLVSRRGRSPTLQRGADFGAPNCRHYPNQTEYHDRLDHCEAAPTDVEHNAAALSPGASRGPTEPSAVECLWGSDSRRTLVKIGSFQSYC